MRKWVFVFFVLNLFLLIYSVYTLSQEATQLLGLSLAHSIFMAFALVLLSFWVWQDGDEIESLNASIEWLRIEMEKTFGKKVFANEKSLSKAEREILDE